jgi:hypothetical protein
MLNYPLTDIIVLREYIVASGRLVPATGVDRGPLLLGDQERWFHSIHTTAMSVIVRLEAGLGLPLIAIPFLMALTGAPDRLIFNFVAMVVCLLSLNFLTTYMFWVYSSVNGYKRLGLSPGPHANGLELPAVFTARPMLLPQTKTVFVPYSEFANIDTGRSPYTWFLQDTVSIWLRNGKPLRVPTRFLEEDGIAMLRDALARGPVTVGAPKLVLYGPTSWDGPRPAPVFRSSKESDRPDRG